MGKIIVTALVIIGVGIVTAILMKSVSKPVPDAVTIKTTTNNSIEKKEVADNEGSGSEKKSVPENWKMYSSDSLGFSLYYDPALTLTEDTENEVRFYKYGPTQKGQTEIYDGIIVTIRKVDISGDGQAYIDNQIAQFENVGTITVPLHDGNLNGIPVKEYSASGLGDFDIIFVTTKDQALLEISSMAPDPTQAGFPAMVDLMLSTFYLHP